MTTAYYLHLKKLERQNELEGGVYETWDNKKLEKLCAELYGTNKIAAKSAPKKEITE